MVKLYKDETVKKIIQIIPAPDWCAEFEINDEEGDLIIVPVICFALVEMNDERQEVRGMISDLKGLEFCEDSLYFRCYKEKQIKDINL